VQRTRTDDERRPDGFGQPFLVKHPPRHILQVFLLIAVAAVVFAAPRTAVAKSTPPCWKTLINDWYDGRIDGTYPIHCYREALDHLPADVDTYSSARDDIKQALQVRIAQSHGGGGGTTGATGPTGSTSSSSSNSSGPKNGGKPPSGPIKSAINAVGPHSATSVPVPLIVLGAVALLLMAAGGAGFLTRRARTRRLEVASAATLPNRTSSGPPTEQ
jgi:hypothetical protein